MERPILMSAPMVRATLNGTKTQTRRTVKHCRQFAEWNTTPDGAYHIEMSDDESGAHFLCAGDQGYTDLAACPYGKPGDRLWVKETHRSNGENVVYRAGGEAAVIPMELSAGMMPESENWRPSIFMPRWASRITLEIVSVRVERLQEISEADAIAEGIEPHEHIGWKHYGREGAPFQPQMTERGSYMTLWESINGAGSWTANPWVWVVTFRRVAP